MLQRLSCLSILLALALAGCGGQGSAERVKYQKDEDLKLTAAATDGDYALYTGQSPQPQLVQHVNQGDRLGFDKTATGRIRAVAGPATRLLPPDTIEARWELRK